MRYVLNLKESTFKRKPKLNEDWLNEDKTMIITDDALEIKNKLLNADRMTRVLCDGILNKYMLCDGYQYVHEDMINAAFDNYYYPFSKGGFLNSGLRKAKDCPQSIFISYVPKSAKECEDLDKLFTNMASDSYTTKYEYKDGYIFSQERGSKKLFKDDPLYTAMGGCLNMENIENLLPLTAK